MRLSAFGWTKEQVKDKVKESLDKEQVLESWFKHQVGLRGHQRSIYILVSLVCQEGFVEDSYCFWPKTRTKQRM